MTRERSTRRSAQFVLHVRRGLDRLPVLRATSSQPGFQAESVEVPRLAVRVDLFGHHFTKHLSAQVTYMRPARFVAYNNVNGMRRTGQVSTAYGGVTLVWDMPVNASRVGLRRRRMGCHEPVRVRRSMARPRWRAAHYAAGLLGAGLAYHATPNIDLMFGATYSPGRKSFDQPSTRLFTTGLRYHMRPLPGCEVEGNRRGGLRFPRTSFGWGTRRTCWATASTTSSRGRFRFSGAATWKRGAALRSTISATCSIRRSVFAFDFGASASYWNSNGNREVFRTLSVYPLFRFFVARPNQPTSISATRSPDRPSSAGP